MSGDGRVVAIAQPQSNANGLNSGKVTVFRDDKWHVEAGRRRHHGRHRKWVLWLVACTVGEWEANCHYEQSYC